MYLRAALVVSCIFSACAKPPDHVREALRVSESVSDSLQARYGFASLGSGGDFQSKVMGFYADFETMGIYNKDEAKEMLVKCVDEYIESVNQDEGVRSYLAVYPITSQQVSVSIAFVDEKRKPRDELSQIHLYNDEIYYSTYNPEKKAFIATDHEHFQKSASEVASESFAASL